MSAHPPTALFPPCDGRWKRSLQEKALGVSFPLSPMCPSCFRFIVLHGNICILCMYIEHSDRCPSPGLYMPLPGLQPWGIPGRCITVLSITVSLFLYPSLVTLPHTSGLSGMRGSHTHLSGLYQQPSVVCKPSKARARAGKGVTAPPARQQLCWRVVLFSTSCSL